MRTDGKWTKFLKRLSPSELIKSRLQQSSVHFQVALQVLDLTPRNIRRIIETGYWMYRGGKTAKMPLFLHIEPTGVCNLKCTMCPRTESITRELRHMSFENFKTILDSVDPIFVAFVGFGEPLLNPCTLDMVRYAVKQGINTRITSNATMLNTRLSQRILDSGLHQIWFSVDSPTPENFERIRVGAKFESTMAGIKEFMQIRADNKSTIKVTVNFTITKENAHEVPQMVKFCHGNLKLLVTFANSYGYDIKEQHARRITASEAETYIEEGRKTAAQLGLVEVEHNLATILGDVRNPLKGTKRPCYFPYYVTAVSWDGKVNPCCLFYDYQMNLGNFENKSFDEIWNGKAYQGFRIHLKSHRNEINICRTCPLHDVSLHNIMSSIYKLPGAKFLTYEKYERIDRRLSP